MNTADFLLFFGGLVVAFWPSNKKTALPRAATTDNNGGSSITSIANGTGFTGERPERPTTKTSIPITLPAAPPRTGGGQGNGPPSGLGPSREQNQQARDAMKSISLVGMVAPNPVSALTGVVGTVASAIEGVVSTVSKIATRFGVSGGGDNGRGLDGSGRSSDGTGPGHSGHGQGIGRGPSGKSGGGGASGPGGGGGRGSCFGGDTLILMHDGAWVKIKDISVGMVTSCGRVLTTMQSKNICGFYCGIEVTKNHATYKTSHAKIEGGKWLAVSETNHYKIINNFVVDVFGIQTDTGLLKVKHADRPSAYSYGSHDIFGIQQYAIFADNFAGGLDDLDQENYIKKCKKLEVV